MGRNNTARATLEIDLWEDWGRRLRVQTQRELALYCKEDWVETLRSLLGGCPDKVETAILMICLELRTDPTNENLAVARRYLTWALQDIVKAQMIAKTRL